ncbi:MAG: hypothetical protein FJ297_18270 [Planctomycetes bacterium]|nr:hypothetical protein [Planctomycetota bacterium]
MKAAWEANGASAMVRRRFLRGLGALAALWNLRLPIARGQVKDGTPALREQLEKGLKARFPNEFAFINTVVTMVAAGQLPLDLVQGTFLWVRKNKYHKKYMVPYFERLLRAKATERGIAIP